MGADPATISLHGGYGLDRLDDLVAQLSPWIDNPITEPVVLDLSGLTFIGPSCLALLAAACCQFGDDSLTDVVPPGWNVRNYLERMDFFDLVPCDVERWSVRHRTSEGFRECQRFSSLEDCTACAPRLVAAIAESCPMDRESRQALEICLEELAENVVFHAGRSASGFAVAQTFRAHSKIEVGIVDLGRGIRASLIENVDHDHLATDAEAIQAATQLGVTATPERNSGQGLFFTARLLQQNGGEMLIRSGTGRVYDGARSSSENDCVPLSGTAVALIIDTRHPLDAGAVSRLIGELKGGDDDPDDLFD
jgi:anti-sigma regulatory factor (Ser/Thr protein kinase)